MTCTAGFVCGNSCCLPSAPYQKCAQQFAISVILVPPRPNCSTPSTRKLSSRNETQSLVSIYHTPSSLIGTSFTSDLYGNYSRRVCSNEVSVIHHLAANKESLPISSRDWAIMREMTSWRDRHPRCRRFEKFVSLSNFNLNV